METLAAVSPFLAAATTTTRLADQLVLSEPSLTPSHHDQSDFIGIRRIGRTSSASK